MVPIYQKYRFLYRAFPEAAEKIFYPARGDRQRPCRRCRRIQRSFAVSAKDAPLSRGAPEKKSPRHLDNVDIREYNAGK